MTIIRWQPFTELETVRRQMDQVFDELIRGNSYYDTWKPAIELQDTHVSFV